MKTFCTYLIIGLALFMAGCKKDPIVLPDALTTAKANLEAQFDAINLDLAAGVDYAVSTGLDTTLIRAKLLELLNRPSLVEEFCFVTPQGILSMIEPSTYYYSQGIDISHQDHIIKSFDTKSPVLSKVFQVVEGYYAAALIHPVVEYNTIKGGVVVVIKTEELLASVLEPILAGADFELWVMEKGGRTLYDQDESEIGLNLFTDPAYKDFPELITAAGRINDEESGTTTYSFYKTGTSTTVTKLTYWTTVEVYGMEWKVVWVKAE
jgi:hypothetical protein